jgi:hypothetical protein
VDSNVEDFDRIPSESEIKELVGEDFIIKLKSIPEESESKRLDGVFNAHLFFELSFVPIEEELVNFELIPHVVEGAEVFLDHPPTDRELYNLQRMQRLIKDRNLHIHILTTYVPGYEDRKKYKGFRYLPYFNFLLTALPNFEVRGDLQRILPPPNVLLLLDHVPTQEEMVECRRIRPPPYIGILLDHTPNEEEFLRLRDEMSNVNTIVYFNLGRDLKEEEVEYMKKSWIPFTVVSSRDEAVISLLSL